jgi:phage gpG-like protein
MPWVDLVMGGRWKGKGANRYFQTDYRILQDTGALRQSFIPLHDENSTGVGAASGSEHADIAERHQFGDPSGNLPARPMLPEPDAAVRIVSKIYGLVIEEATK